MRDPFAYLVQASYPPLLHTTFRLEHSDGVADAELVDVKDLVPAELKAAGKAAEVFSLTFETLGPGSFAQGTYPLQHPSLGSFQLFLVPVGQGPRGFLLEAVVNRLDA
jgi:hypothetical protein